MTSVDNRSSQSMSYALLMSWLCLMLAMMPGCSSSDGEYREAVGEKTTSPPEEAAGDDSFLSTTMSALSEGQLTLNKPWDQADLNFENIAAVITYEGKTEAGDRQPPGRMRPYTTLVQQYRVRRKQCEEDAKVLNSKGEPTCYPVQTNPNAANDVQVDPCGGNLNFQVRYGYYCGRGFPDHGPFRDGAPEPLDGVDYCCRLHDQCAWREDGPIVLGFNACATGDENTCGIVMCLQQASGWPANITALLPDVEEARQCWYDKAASACNGDQRTNAKQPELGP